MKPGCLHLLAPGHVTGFREDHMCRGGQEGWRLSEVGQGRPCPGDVRLGLLEGRGGAGRVRTVGALCAGVGDCGAPLTEMTWAGLSGRL